jgi:hypothetical protein
MESGSLLSEALQYMQSIQDQQHNTNANIYQQHQNVNVLLISLYCIDQDVDTLYHDNDYSKRRRSQSDDIDKDDAAHNERKEEIESKNKIVKQKEIQSKLSYIHSIIHSKLLPRYKQDYNHAWFTGGEGISFGLNCCSSDDIEEESKTPILTPPPPHLKTMIQYGPNPMDEQFALCTMLQLSHDLYHLHNINVAISCWDMEDGQILLIEGATSLASWVDDIIGVQNMKHRVYIVNGKIRLLDPSIKKGSSSSDSGGRNTLQNGNYHHDDNYYLTIQESLHALISHGDTFQNTNQLSRDEFALNQIIHERFHPFLQMINHHQVTMSQPQRTLLKDYIHTSAIVLPLPIALLIRQRPDLVPSAVLQFCELGLTKLQKEEEKK